MIQIPASILPLRIEDSHEKFGDNVEFSGVFGVLDVDGVYYLASCPDPNATHVYALFKITKAPISRYVVSDGENVWATEILISRDAARRMLKFFDGENSRADKMIDIDGLNILLRSSDSMKVDYIDPSILTAAAQAKESAGPLEGGRWGVSVT